MKMYASDLREGDKFDVDEFVSRKGFFLTEPAMEPVTITRVNGNMDRYTAIEFNTESLLRRTYRWTLRDNDMVEVEGW